ncbi:MAG TPA: alpha/beta hydrolase [Leptolyngbyaceae cyanobacterium M33_DOE_097]|uniref:Alpha/beta hydrolase n=1 Tax=Oscillatoriales cyanobacterium SpSt-418 TaxID=2282169 RepID=A0A7C3KBI6_9CYAN|nr:alpha/beta hydrolase [Leptolyngbyaceae cyanobacterium M33_DOE_097]
MAEFLPAAITQLTEPESIELVRLIERSPISTPLLPEPITTAFVRQGTQTPNLVLLHGFDSSLLEFRRLFPRLAARYTTWAIDLLGFGFSDRPRQTNLTPDAIKTHLYYTWKSLIGEPMVLVAASMGGAAAIDFALTYPEAVHKLVLIDSAGFAAGPNISRFMIPPLGYLAAEFLRNPRVRRSVSFKAYYDPKFVTPDAELCGSLHLACDRWRETIISFTKSGGYNFLSDKISQITCPTLILWGENDQILGTKDAQRFAAKIAASQLVWVPECGHIPHLEKPQFTAEQILQFVGG